MSSGITQSRRPPKETESRDRRAGSEHPAECYTPADLVDQDFHKEIGRPGECPFTRGIHANLYGGRLWTMRQFAGFGTPRQTNERFRF